MIPQTPIYRNVRKMEKFVISLSLRAPIRRSIVACLALVTVCALLLLNTVNVQASTITINDQAGVLDAGRVQAEAEQLPILIFTTKTFTGEKDAFNQYTREQLPNQDSIAIGIDTVHVTISIVAGTNVQLSNSQANDAYSAAVSNYESGGGYTGATLAAIDSLKGALGGGGGMTPLGMAVLILLGLVVVGLIVIAKRWRRRRGDSDGDLRIWNPYYGGIYPTGIPPSAYYGGSDGGAGGSFGGGAGGSSGGESSGGGAGGHL